MIEWHEFVAEQKEKELAQIISQEGLKDAETRKFVDYSFRDGNMKTTGTDIDKIMPAMSRFGGGNREIKKKILQKNFWHSSKNFLELYKTQKNGTKSVLFINSRGLMLSPLNM